MVITLLFVAALAPALDADLRAAAALPGEPSTVAAAALTKDGGPVLTIENGSAFDVVSKARRVVVIGKSEAAAATVVAMVRWFKSDRAAAALRKQWALSALPLAVFDASDTRSLPRWLTFQAADVVVEVGDGDGVDALAPALRSA